jgi:hypothetical protein
MFPAIRIVEAAAAAPCVWRNKMGRRSPLVNPLHVK